MRRIALRWRAVGWTLTAALAITLVACVPSATALGRQAPTPPTTPAPISARIPPPVATVPLVTKAQNAHVDPLLAYLSGGGFFVALVIMGTQYVLTRPGRRGRTL